MSKIISCLWNGQLDPIRYLGKNNSEMKQLEHFMQRNLDALEKVLTEHDKVLFKKYSDCVNEYIVLISEQSFCDGFSIGAKIVTDALTDAERIL